jgi:hypothetical protein
VAQLRTAHSDPMDQQIYLYILLLLHVIGTPTHAEPTHTVCPYYSIYLLQLRNSLQPAAQVEVARYPPLPRHRLLPFLLGLVHQTVKDNKPASESTSFGKNWVMANKFEIVGVKHPVCQLATHIMQ